jgi:two-component system response regulator VicR
MASIFILDDTNDILFALDIWLTQHGYEVYTFSTSKDLIDSLTFITPDFILLDVRLAEIKDGRILCMELKQHYQFPNSIYLFSVCSITNFDLLDCGADGFIKKPFELHEMLNTINDVLVDV